MYDSAIEVVGARTHNLKGVDCEIPHGRVTVVTGVSGAGKSSLVFDTVYAEAQRRFVESMSTYARQFLDQMERPPVDALRGVLPAVALEARNSVKNARSTVGTLTEVHDVLRLLYTHLGEVICPDHGALRRFTPEDAADALAEGAAGESFVIVVRLSRPANTKTANAKLKELIRQGFARRLEKKSGEMKRMESAQRWLKTWSTLPLVLGRFKADPDGPSSRLISSIEDAYLLGGGRFEAHGGEIRYFGRSLTCDRCGLTVPRPTPALFSFNSPLGACPTCQGFGRVMGVDAARVIPDPRRSLIKRPIAPWNTPAYAKHYRQLYAACRDRGVPLDVPWEEMSEIDRRWVWSGSGSKGGASKDGFTSIEKFFAWMERKSYRMHLRILLARYRAYETCPECGGARLKPAGLAVRLRDQTLPQVTGRTIEQLLDWLREARWTRAEKARAGHLLDELRERVETLHRVGLDYLTLNRQARTLSGGEVQRIHLATALGSGLTSTLYVLDEPTIGLHPRDSNKLLALLHDLAARGNTVLVVEHDRTLIEGADHVIDLGPRAGEHGGEVLAAGSIAQILADEASITGQWLREKPSTLARRHAKRWRREHGVPSLEEELRELPRLRIRGARANNLRGVDVDLPLAALVVVTGVSGSGKSTLVENVLHGTYQRSRGVVDVEPGECEALEGLEALADVTLIDQRPLGRSARSNPVTYSKAWDDIRKLFAQTENARRGGITAGHFSFNVDKGRCEECKGTGVIEVDMQFMAPVTVVCDVCQGRRFQRRVLDCVLRGRNVHETLELTVEKACEVFADRPGLCRKLGALCDVGLGYLRLGQTTSTLSGGEAQRLKLASFLHRPKKEARRLFLFDEPTTGLHMADIDLLYRTLRRLVRGGHGVIVVEHSLDLVAKADWIVDLGPGGGSHGGELLYSGTLENFVDTVDSPTAKELRRHLGRRKRKARR